MKFRSVAHCGPVLVTAGLATAMAIAGSGCTSSRVIRHNDLRPGDIFARGEVFLHGGARYEFARIAVYPDTVVGEYKITVERSSSEGRATNRSGVYYEDETHAHRMALDVVDSVAVLRHDPVKTMLYATGAAGVGLLVFKAIDAGSPEKDGASNPKSMGASP